MQLFGPKQTKDAKDAEISRDILRTETVREALKRSQKELNDVNDRFEIALANQRVRWAAEELEFTTRITALRKELETMKVIPIVRTDTVDDTLEELLKEKLDALSDKEIDLEEREQKILIKEEALKFEYEARKESSKLSSPQKI